MSLSLPETDDTQLNMTPMIDIVFQLVTFFLLTLHFSTPEDRLESQLPRDPGLEPTFKVPKDSRNVRVKLFRRDREDPALAHTVVRVGNGWELALPKGPWPSDTAGADRRQREIDAAYSRLADRLRSEWAAQGNDPEVQVEVVAPPPTGGAVPHGDAVRVMDTAVEVGLVRVMFEGAIPPVSNADGGTLLPR
jgi:biopolymer transport protein ExbD